MRISPQHLELLLFIFFFLILAIIVLMKWKLLVVLNCFSQIVHVEHVELTICMPYLRKFLSLNFFLPFSMHCPYLSIESALSGHYADFMLLNPVVNFQSLFPISSQPQWTYASWKHYFHFAVTIIFCLLDGCSKVSFISIIPNSKFLNSWRSYPDDFSSLSTLISFWCSGCAVILWPSVAKRT